MEISQLLPTNTKLTIKWGMEVDIEFTTNIEAPLWDSLSPILFIFDPYMAIYYIDWIGRSNL